MKLFKSGVNEPSFNFENENDYITMLKKINAIYEACDDKAHDLVFQKAIRYVIDEMVKYYVPLSGNCLT